MTMGGGHMTTLDEAKLRTRAFMVGIFSNYDLKDDEDIFESGFVNSLFALQLVMFVEKTFEVTVEDEDLDLDNFRSIVAVADFVRRKAA
jgi:methoxymalonate biosynthesis acyl carrier protein